MTPNPSFVLAALIFLAAGLPAHAGPGRPSGGRRAGGGSWSGGPEVTKDQVENRARQEFQDVRRAIERDHELNPMKKTFLANVQRTEDGFTSNAQAILKQSTYGGWEFEYLGKQVTAVVTALKASSEIEARFADDDPRKGQALADAASASMHELNVARTFAIQSLRSGIGINLSAELPGGDSSRLRREPPWWEKLTPEEAIAKSQVVKLADECAQAAVLGKEPVPTPNPDPVTPVDPIDTNPDRPGPITPVPAPPAPLPKPVDVIGPIFSPGGRSQSYVDQGAGALQSGEYARAAALARKALALDPENRSALAIFQTAKGRDGAVGSGETGSRVAVGGAAALGSSGFASAGAAGAGLSPEMAALTRSGAARLAGEQASAGAKNALKLGDAQGAIAILDKALAQDPNNPALLNYRALAYGRLGRWEEALKDTAAGLALAPGNTALLGVQALAQNRTRRWRDALASSEALLAADPRSAWGYAARAHAHGGLGNREAMLADIDRAAALDPSFRRAAAEAAELQLPSDSDVMFLFPGESGKAARPVASAGRGRTFSVVVGAGIVGGLLFALGLLSLVLAPIKDSIASVFTRAKRTGPATAGAVATAQPVSVAGNVGGLIRGQYEVSRQIGAGGMGMVYEGTDRSLGRRVAIKKMRDEMRLNPRERDRFVIEAKTVASLHHPSIVDIYAIAEEGDDVYLVFEYVDGRTVHDLVQTKGRLEPVETLRVARAMGDALAYAHSRGVIHRDMKPSNVMVTSSGQVKVMDFGIARMAKDALTRYSMTNTVVGTPPYMAPEQEQGVVRKESDVYSLAICAYEMLTGKLPFIGIGAGMLMNKINMSYVPPSRAIAGLPEPLDEVFLKAFQADPDQRYRTPQEFVAALAAAADGARSRSA